VGDVELAAVTPIGRLLLELSTEVDVEASCSRCRWSALAFRRCSSNCLTCSGVNWRSALLGRVGGGVVNRSAIKYIVEMGVKGENLNGRDAFVRP